VFGAWLALRRYVPAMQPVEVQVWSDIACPWCYVGKRRLEAAIARMPGPGRVRVVWRAFELDPSAPPVHQAGTTYAERLARKYGTAMAEAQAMIDRMTSIAAADGLTFRFDRIRPGNTFDAHRLLHLARERGIQDAVKERFLRAYMTEGEPIGEPGVLARLAAEAGLDAAEVRAVLGSSAHAEAVRADEAEAHALGIRGVPFFVLGGACGVSGAQPAEVLHEALVRASRAPPVQGVPDGAACGPGGCG
jgi:predicted DsbA family dithiol-disulfide isomerase